MGRQSLDRDAAEGDADSPPDTLQSSDQGFRWAAGESNPEPVD